MTKLSTLAAAILLATAVFSTGPAWAAPVPDAERIPVDIRRTTFVVRDIDKSLPLYRDALGLKVIYDQLIGGGKNADGSVRPPSIRLVLLRANDTFIGVLGLMQRLQAPPVPPPEFKKAGPGGSVIPVMFSSVWDADGNFIELNKLLGAPAGTTAPAPAPAPAPTQK